MLNIYILMYLFIYFILFFIFGIHTLYEKMWESM
jgi:hypothetical protein